MEFKIYAGELETIEYIFFFFGLVFSQEYFIVSLRILENFSSRK